MIIGLGADLVFVCWVNAFCFAFLVSVLGECDGFVLPGRNFSADLVGMVTENSK